MKEEGAKPKNKKGDSQPVNTENEDCKICDVMVKYGVKGIKCDVCENWCHIECVGMEEKTYKHYSKGNLQWVCEICMKVKIDNTQMYEMIGDLLKMTKIERKNNEQERAQLIEMMKDMSEKITMLEGVILKKVNEKVKGIEKDVIIKVKEEIGQELEKFKRRKNIVIYGLPEGEGRTEKEAYQMDHDNVQQLIREIGTDVETFRIIRLGKQKIKNKTRPIKVELSEEAEKYKILKKAANVRNLEAAKFKSIIITTDMTVKQRELEKILREDLKNRREAGETDIKIKNGRIVKSGPDVEGAGAPM